LDDAAAVPLASRSGSLSSGPASLVSASLLSSTITVSLTPEEKKNRDLLRTEPQSMLAGNEQNRKASGLAPLATYIL
jgi:hypothetical protein